MMSSMATETKPPHKKLIIKFRCPRPSDHIPHDRSEMEEKKEVQRITAKEKSREVAKGSRTVSKVCPMENKKGYNAVAVWGKPENPSNSSARLDSRTLSKGHEECKLKKKREIVPDSRTSRRGSEECKSKNKRKSVGVKWNKREKKGEMKHTMMMMDSRRKMQCWVLLKRVMVGRDVWALKEPLLHHNSESVRKPKRNGLEDIESKLRKLGYSYVDEFAHDVRLVFSYSLGYPPRSEVHRTAKRISQGFEVSWKRLKRKWMRE